MSDNKHYIYGLAESYYQALCNEFNFVFGSKGSEFVEIPFNVPGRDDVKMIIIVQHSEIKEIQARHDCGIIERYRYKPGKAE